MKERLGTIIKKMHMGDAGFTLTELIIAISIMSLMTGLMVPNYHRLLERSKERRAMINAYTLLKTAKLALTTTMIDNTMAFNYAIKFCDIPAEYSPYASSCGRFSNASVYNYLMGSGGAKSKPSDVYMASMMVNNIPGTPNDTSSGTLTSKAPVDKAIKEIAEKPEVYGATSFCMAYDGYGRVLYFDSIYDGYYCRYSIINDKVEVDNVKEYIEDNPGAKFKNWPKTRLAYASDW